MMRFIIAVCLGFLSVLGGAELPGEEGLSVSVLDNGVQIWLKEQPLPAQSISCRIVAKKPHEGVPRIFPINDCPLEAFEDELLCLIDKSLSKEEECDLAFVAVGDFDRQQLGDFLTQALGVLSKRNLPASPPPLTVYPSTLPGRLSLYYHNGLQELKTDRDMKKLWAIYLLQAMVQERFRKAIAEGGGAVVPTETEYLLLATHSMLHSTLLPHHDPALLLAKCLKALQEIKKGGFTDVELSGAKLQLQNKLSLFYQRTPDNSLLADYCASHFAYGAGCPAYPVFMTMSFTIIQDIEMPDILEVMDQTFKDGDRRVEVAAAQQVSEAPLLAALEELKADGILFVPGSMEAPDVLKKAREAFAKLPLSETEKGYIYELVDTVGKTDWYLLLPKKWKMEELGKNIRHIHPLKFLEVVFSNARLKKAMGEIFFDSHLKRNGFLRGSSDQPGFGDKMDNEFNHDNLFPHLLGFSQAVNASPDQIRGYFVRKDWRGLVEFLINL